MNLKELIEAINRRVDDVIINEDGVDWLNSGQNKMAIAVKAKFPQVQLTSDMSDTFVFPEKYHEIPVLYASSMYKIQDSSIREANNLMALFDESLKNFVIEYSVPPQYRDDTTTEQFTATANQTTFTISKNTYNETFGDLVVYVNGERTTAFSKNDNTFTLINPATEGDKITAVWEIHTDMVEPPYTWWRW